MALINEELIHSLAPSVAAVRNGLQLSQLGKFSNRCCTEDKNIYWADCTGSGSSIYRTSVDFTDNQNPTCRCSCPSRQFPCKHALGLLFDIVSNKIFTLSSIPPDLLEKLQKSKKQRISSSRKTKLVSSKSDDLAQKKKIAKQLEGCELAEKMIGELLNSGFTSLTGTISNTYKDTAKNFSNYYLPGIQTSFLRLAWAIEHLQSESSTDNSLKSKILYNA
ncbi:MAG: SWIM zinc finger domain-containing protein [Candidatus Bruticola sp.]